MRKRKPGRTKKVVSKRKVGRPRILRKSRISKKFIEEFKPIGIQVPKPLPNDIIAMAKKYAERGPRCEICNARLNQYNTSKRCSIHQVKSGIGDPYALQKEEV